MSEGPESAEEMVRALEVETERRLAHALIVRERILARHDQARPVDAPGVTPAVRAPTLEQATPVASTPTR